MAFIGLDIGTTGCKSVVFDEKGKELFGSYLEYDAKRNKEVHELDGVLVFEAVKKVIYSSVQGSSDKEMKAIAITSFGESFVPVDENGNPLDNAMLYTDKRGTLEASFLEGKIDYLDVGMLPHGMYSLPKIMWIKNNSPRVYNKAYKMLLFEDYIVFRLCGEAEISYSLASRTMAFDVINKKWNKKVLDLAEIDENKLSKAVPAGSVAGKIKPDLAFELGVSRDTLIINVGIDQIAAAVGAGAIMPGITVNGSGTVECITPVFDMVIDNSIMSKGGYCLAPHAVDGYYSTFAISYTGGGSLKWFKNTFTEMDHKELDALVEDNPSSLLFLPYLAGAATPYMDENATGAIIGLNLGTTRIDIYKSIMEGVALDMFLNINTIAKAGIDVAELRTTGGGAKSPKWLQIKADITGIPITALKSSEAGCLGCAMIAAVAEGNYKSLFDASKDFVRLGESYLPTEAKHQLYMEKYHKYIKMYQSTRNVLS